MLYPSFLHHSFSSFYPARCHAAIASASFLGSPLFVFVSPLCAWGQMYGRVSVDCLGLVLWCGVSQDVRGCREDNAHLHTPHGPWALPSTVCSHISPFQHHTSTHTLSRSPPNILFHRMASNSSSVRNICSVDTPQWKRVVLIIALGFYSTKAAKQIKQWVLCSLAAY